MDYIPKIPQQPQAPPTYELVKDVTRKPPVARGIFTLKDKNGTEVRLPHPPNPDCKRCHGRGYTGTDAKTGKLLICLKCYKLT